MNEERKIERVADKVIRLWPIAAVLVAGATGYIRLQIAVDGLQASQARWQNSAESRRERAHDEIDSIKERLARIEAQMACGSN